MHWYWLAAIFAAHGLGLECRVPRVLLHGGEKMPAPRSLSHRVADWLDDNGVDTALFALPLILSVSGIVIGDEAMNLIKSCLGFSEAAKGWVQFVLLVMIIAITLLHLIVHKIYMLRKKKVSDLVSKVDALESEIASWAQDAKTLAAGYLYTFSTTALQFGSRNRNSERITLYVHDGEGHFVPVARYSSNAAYSKTGRTRYPDSQGCIGRAWHNEEFFLNDYPDPAEDMGEYIRKSAELDLPPEVVRSLRMKSRLLYGRRIDDDSGVNPLAVVIIESTEPDRFTFDDLSGQFGPSGQRYIRGLAQKLSAKLPHISEARKMGL